MRTITRTIRVGTHPHPLSQRAKGTRARSAFSLLEMVLALALAMVIMLALYLTLNTYLTSAHGGRDTLAEGEIPRSVVAKMTHDITNQLGALDTRCMPDYAAAAAAASGTSTTPTDPTMAPTVVPNSVLPDSTAYNIGVQGSGSTLRLAIYRVENPPVGAVADPNQNSQSDIMCDLRRVDYWIVGQGDKTLGLARREVKMATSNDIDTSPSELGDQEKYIIAREISGLTFQFFDGSAWQDSWDGYQPKAEGDGTPTGPPAAIKVTMKIQRQTSKLFTIQNETAPPELTYTFVVAVPGGNNFTPKTAGP